jgi:hypothetical protein
MPSEITRRSFVKETVIASAGAALALGSTRAGDAAAAEPAKPAQNPPAPKNTLPRGKIGDMEISRMVLGGNLLSHFTHSRDLSYVYNLAAHYNTDDKVMETLALAEAHGINTVSMHNPPHPMSVLRRYRKERKGKIQWIICPTAQAEPGMTKYAQEVQQLIDDGCEAIYLWGVRADGLLAEGKIDLIGKAVELAKAQGVPSGVGCHNLDVVVACEKNKIPADFYIKTFHHHNYPSAKLNYDSSWCSNPEETAAFMRGVTKPWIAFKTMAAGAIPPRSALEYVFTHGADFVLFGMFDYEIAEDVQILKDVLAHLPKRERPWRG